MSDLFKKIIYPFDQILIGYCLLMIALISIMGEPFGAHGSNLIFYLSMIILTVLIIYFVDEHKNRFPAFVRFVYPAILFTFFYRNTGDLVFLFFDRFLDADLMAFEIAVFGVSPSLYVDKFLTGNVIVNEFFSMGYFSYYFMIPALIITALIRRHDHVLRSGMTSLTLVFFISYLLFNLIPVESPRWFLADQFQAELPGWFFRDLTMMVMDQGGLHGGAMPSSHVAVALVCMMYCLRYYRRLGYLMLVLNILLIGGTVWGRFHYLSDVVAGIFFGIIPVLLVWKYYDARLDDKTLLTEQKEPTRQNVT